MATGKVYAKPTVVGGGQSTADCGKKISHVTEDLNLFVTELDRSEKLVLALENCLIGVLRQDQDQVCAEEIKEDSPKIQPVPLAENILEGVKRQRIANNRIESVLSRLEV